MLTALVIFVSAFLLCLLFTPPVRMLAIRLNWFDQPDQDRKRHRNVVPRIGGVSVMLGYFGSTTVAVWVALHSGFALHPAFQPVWQAVPFVLLAFVTGLLDDIVQLKAEEKLFGQIVAAALATSSGLQLHSFAGRPLEPYIGVPITILWLLACMNAFNLMDGMDGLAGGIGLLGSLAVAVGGLLCGDMGLTLLALPLAGALAAFLVFNWSPASIFLGDSGSLAIGFLLGSFGVRWANEGPTLLSGLAPLAALAVPLLDMTLTIVRRYLAGRPIFQADNRHIHFHLVDLGHSPLAVVRLLWSASAVGAVVAAILTAAETPLAAAVCLLLTGAFVSIINILRYPEFLALAGILRDWKPRSSVKMRLALLNCEAALRDAPTPEECHSALQAAGPELGFACSALKLGESFFWEEQGDYPDAEAWKISIPLSGLGYVALVPAPGQNAFDKISGQLTNVLKRTLEGKAAALRIEAPSAPEPSLAPRPVPAGTLAAVGEST